MVAEVPHLKIVYRPLPKAACSSVKSALALIDPRHEASRDKILADELFAHGVYQTDRFRGDRWLKYDDWWRFAVVRDPIKRLMSVYTDLVVGRKSLHHSAQIKRQNLHPKDPDPDYFFQNIQEYRRLSSTVKHHSISAWFFLGPKPLQYDQVYRVDEIASLEARLSELAKQKVVVPRFNSSSSKLEYAELNEKTKESLHEFLLGEYTYLSEYFENPL